MQINKGAYLTMRTIHRFLILLVILALLIVPLGSAFAQAGEGASTEAPAATEESTSSEATESQPVESAEGEEASIEEGEAENAIPQGISLLIFLLGLLGIGIVGLVSIRSGSPDDSALSE